MNECKFKIHDLKGSIIKTITCNLLLSNNVRYDLIYKLILWQRAVLRAPIAHTKQLSEVSGSTRKIYKQKGTGSARHGSNRRVQFRGGAVVFGPNNKRCFEYKLNKKEKKLALQHVLAHMYHNNLMLVIKNIALNTYKTSKFFDHFCNFKISKKSKVLFIDKKIEKNFSLASRNIVNVKGVSSLNATALDILNHGNLIFSEEGLLSFIGRLR